MIIPPELFAEETFCDADIEILENFENEEVTLFETESLFNHIKVTENSLGRFLKFDESYQAADIRLPQYQGGFPYIYYYYFAPLFNTNIKRVLIAGLGNGKLAAEILEAFPQIEQIDIVELDYQVLEVARDYFDFKETSKIKVHIQDARIFIRNAKVKYDYIILDVFSQDGLPYRLITDEFFKEVKNAMTPDGIFTANLFSLNEINSIKNYFLKTIINTMKENFSQIKLFPTFTGNIELYNEVFGLSQSFSGMTNLIVFASNLALSAEELARNVKISQNNITNKNLHGYAEDMLNTEIDTSNFRILYDRYENDSEFTLDNLFNYLYINHKENA